MSRLTEARAVDWPAAWGFTDRFVALPDLRMHIVEAGPLDGPPVIMLHGFPETAYTWRKQMGPLTAAGFRVVAPDLRGYNLTDKHGPYDMATVVADIVHLMDALGFEQACVVGHDWGANVAWRLNDWYPERLRRLAILNLPRPQILYRLLLQGDLEQLLRSWYVYFFQLRGLPERLLSANDYHLMRRLIQDTALPTAFSDHDLDVYTAAWRQPGAFSAMIGYYRVEFGRKLRDRSVEPLPPVTIPTLMVWGRRDVALAYKGAQMSAATLGRGALVTFRQASHFVHEEFPAAVNGLLLSFFNGD